MAKWKRKLIQLFAALIYNSNFKGWFEGSLFSGATKGVCVPGLNCYSCPGAIGACPLGSLQGSLNSIKTSFPFYVVGTLLLFGALFGRAVCGFFCPFGFIQELLYMIPTKKIRKSRATRAMSWGKYAVLAVFVFALPIYYLLRDGVSSPAFCKFICPSGTLLGGIPLVASNPELFAIVGRLFDWKVLVLVVIVVSSIFIYRPFCRFICPLGAIYSLFNRVALFGVKVDKSRCVGCGECVSYCKSDVKCVNDRECIRCGECMSVCRFGAIYNGVGAVRKSKPEQTVKGDQA